MATNPLDEDLIRRLANLLSETGLSELEIEQDNKRIRVARQINIAATAPIAATQSAAAAAPAPAIVSAISAADHPGAIKSPMVGTAYGAAEPGKPPFIKSGDRVAKGQTLLIIEAMKVMNPIVAANAGVVKDILFKDGQPVEFGEALVVIE
jgi:acetyl-CoA carboxylase biotin carboxyl carrier protein